MRSPSLSIQMVFRWSWLKTLQNGCAITAQSQPQRRNVNGKVIHLHQSTLSLHLRHRRQRSAHMTPPCPHLRNNSITSRRESIALFRDKPKSDLQLNANVTSPSPLFPITCFTRSFDKLRIQSLSSTHSRIRKHLHHRLVLYLNLPPVLQLRLVFLVNVPGQESTLGVLVANSLFIHSYRSSHRSPGKLFRTYLLPF